jgi:uncharacterized protein YndB with AHSA1/START domain
MPERSVVHTTFVIDRAYPVPVARVFAAWSTIEGKSRWFVGGPEWKQIVREMDFRVGGRERLVGKGGSGTTTAFDAHYLEIVPDERIIYSYNMFHNNVRLSVSLATIEFKRGPTGTRLIVTEQGAFLDGVHKPEGREQGTGILMDRLGASLQD